MKTAFIIYGVFLCLLLLYANAYGWVLVDTYSSGKWGPHGHTARTHGFYHK